MKSKSIFTKLSQKAASYTGRPAAFIIAASVIIVWGITGPIFGFNDTWQLVINTGTTIITFLMVFLIQNSQNRDTAALQLKLDELIRVTVGAHNVLLDLEELNEKDLEHFRAEYEKIAEDARNALQSGEIDTKEAIIDVQKLCEKC